MESEGSMDTEALALDLHADYSSTGMTVRDRGDGSTYRLNRLVNGRLDCKFHHSDWCQHIQQALEQDLDHPLMFDSNQELPQKVDIPLVPTKAQWATVLFNGTQPSTGPYEVSLLDPASGGLYFLGFTYPNEGRMIIRSMIYDWFESNTARPDDDWICTITAHGYSASKLLSADLARGGALALAQKWSIWSTGRCLLCDKATKEMLAETSGEAF